VLIAGLKSGSTDRQKAGIAELLAFSQIAAVTRSLLLALLMLSPSVRTAAQADASSVRPVSPGVAVPDHADRATAEYFAVPTNQTRLATPCVSELDEPLSMVVVVDASSSMAARIDEARQALGELIRMSDAREMALVVIHDEPQVVVHRGGPTGQIGQAAETVQGDGFGGMWDGMYLGMRELTTKAISRASDMRKFSQRLASFIDSGGHA